MPRRCQAVRRRPIRLAARRRKRFERKADAETFEIEVKRRQRLGELGELQAASQTVSGLAHDWFDLYVLPNLASRTQRDYARLLDRNIIPRLGSHRLKDVRPDVLDRFRWDLEQDHVGSSQIRQTLVVLQGMFRYAEERGRVLRNPVKLVRKPSGRRQRAIVVLPPRQVEAVRHTLMRTSGSETQRWSRCLPTPACVPRKRSRSSGATCAPARCSSSGRSRSAS